MKQTVEEAAREYANDCRNRQRHCEPYCIVDFIAGAEWAMKHEKIKLMCIKDSKKTKGE